MITELWSNSVITNLFPPLLALFFFYKLFLCLFLKNFSLINSNLLPILIQRTAPLRPLVQNFQKFCLLVCALLINQENSVIKILKLDHKYTLHCLII